ncbi:MAG: hypothetical protein ACI9UT_000077 [Flavobacteriales bacterium]|jgi:hypothetical protein
MMMASSDDTGSTLNGLTLLPVLLPEGIVPIAVFVAAPIIRNA